MELARGDVLPWKSAMRQMNLSARAFHRILKLARTIADLAETDAIQMAHLAEGCRLAVPAEAMRHLVGVV